MTEKSAKIAAIAVGQESTEGAGFVKYIGIAPSKVIAVNPTLEELKALYPDRNYENAPEYVKTREGDSTPMYMINIHVKTNKEHKDSNGLEATGILTFILKPEHATNSDKTKIQVINEYGDSAWITNEELQNKTLPEYAVKNAFATPYRPAFVGEVALIDFIKTHLNIPFYKNYKEGVWSLKPQDELIKSQCSLEEPQLKAIFSGNFSCLKQVFNYQKDNQSRLLWGVRTVEDKQYQEISNRLFAKLGVADPKKIDTELTRIKESGGYSSTEFGVYPFSFQEYSISPSSIIMENTPVPPTSNPFVTTGWV